MKIGLSASILRWLGILCFLAFFVYIGYIELIITSQIGKIPSNSDTQNLVNVAKYMYVFFIIFFIGRACRQVPKVYRQMEAGQEA